MKNKAFNPYVSYILLVVGYIFVQSGYGKITGGTFVNGLAKTLGYFASENPYPPVQSFLTDIAIPNSIVFGNLTILGELIAGISIIGAVVYQLYKKRLTFVAYTMLIIGLLVGLFLNITFWLSSGWTSPSTNSVNLLMAAIEIVALVSIIKTFRTTR